MVRLLMLLVLLGGCARGEPGERFEAQGWRDADLMTRARAGMAVDLIRSHRLDGMDRAAVVALLGEPTQSGVGSDRTMVYVLGPDGTAFPIDHEWLRIELDSRGRVERYRTVVD